MRSFVEVRGGEPMSNFIPLESVDVATPCRADWNRMKGDQTARYCTTCRKSVYNLSSMSRENAQAFVNQNQTACVRFFRRADGTMLLGDCPVGTSVQRRPFWGVAVGFAALLASGAAVFGGAIEVYDEQTGTITTVWQRTLNQWREVPVMRALANRFQSQAVEPEPIVLMGVSAPPDPLAPPRVQR